jgi:hypothetical protein
MRRTYILSTLVLGCVAYIWGKRLTAAHNDLESAKRRIEHIAEQPVSHPGRDRPSGAMVLPARTSESPEPQAPGGESWRTEPATGDDEKVVRLTKGTFTVVDGTIVYGPDAQLDIGHGMLVSSPSGVMVSDADQRHIAGDLVIDTQDGTTTTENAFLSVDSAHVEFTSDSAVTVRKDGPK